jgi:dipeptidyl aminopeptidase/acylaminoacyl peptidase
MLRNFEEVKLGENELKLIENGWGSEVANSIIIKKFLYNSDENSVKGYLAYPKKITEKLPIIIWNRGGNNKSGLLDDFLASGILGEIASWGYTVFASQYREKDWFGGDDVNDVLNLIEIAKEFEFSDEKVIGMEGWSRGGMMTYLALRRTTEIKSCIIVAGLSDLIRNEKLFKELGIVYKRHFGTDDESEYEKRKIERSAVFWTDKISARTNILFIHGTADNKVSYNDSLDVYNKLSVLNHNTKYELRLIDGGDHYLRKERKDVSLLRRKWFDNNLKSKNI